MQNESAGFLLGMRRIPKLVGVDKDLPMARAGAMKLSDEFALRPIRSAASREVKPSTRRVQEHRKRKRNGVFAVVSIPVDGAWIDALIKNGHLEPEMAKDRRAIGAAVLISISAPKGRPD